MVKTRIMLVDDHAVLRAGLKALLNAESDLEVVGEASDGREAIKMVETLQPDVVLMDISMPKMNGLDATREIHRRTPAIKVLALTMHDNNEYLFQILKAGGSGYVLKKAADAELIDAIRAVRRGEAFLYPSAAKMLIEDFLDRAGMGEAKDDFGRLSEREKEVMKLIAEGYTNQEIAEKLVISVKTVETHRAHIMEKLGFSSRAELVRYALRRGLLDPDEL